MKRGKKYKNAAKKITAKTLSLDEAVKKVTELGTTVFKGKIEAHISLNLNEKERKQPIRSNVTFSKPIAKPKKVLVFADPKNQDIALAAGADYAGLEDLIEKIKGGWADFDVAIAIPSVMPKIAVLGRVLGTKGLMPNPKSGTVTDDVKGAIESYKGGKIDFKSDETGVVHSLIGTADSTPEEMKENLLKLSRIVLQTLNKPQGIAIKSVYIAPTMGPSVKIQTESLLKEL